MSIRCRLGIHRYRKHTPQTADRSACFYLLCERCGHRINYPAPMPPKPVPDYPPPREGAGADESPSRWEDPRQQLISDIRDALTEYASAAGGESEVQIEIGWVNAATIADEARVLPGIITLRFPERVYRG